MARWRISHPGINAITSPSSSNPPLHSWTLDPKQAVQLQTTLRQRLVLAWDGREVASVAGVDVGFSGEQAQAAIAILSYPELDPLTSATVSLPLEFPYIPGLLAFREGPPVLAAWEKLPFKPDLLLFDGQGIAHPRRFGLAAHLGLWLETPSIGVAKSWLYGAYAAVGPDVGDRSNLFSEDDPQQRIGVVLRTCQGNKLVYVSPGNLIDVDTAVAFVLACCRSQRLPEPSRWAHRLSKAADI